LSIRTEKAIHHHKTIKSPHKEARIKAKFDLKRERAICGREMLPKTMFLCVNVSIGVQKHATRVALFIEKFCDGQRIRNLIGKST
jgi:hypothetical protein